MEPRFYFEEIDPMALVLSPAAYRIWWEKHHPHEPSVAEIQEVVHGMGPEERKATLAAARLLAAYGKTLAAYGRVVEEAITKL